MIYLSLQLNSDNNRQIRKTKLCIMIEVINIDKNIEIELD